MVVIQPALRPCSLISLSLIIFKKVAMVPALPTSSVGQADMMRLWNRLRSKKLLCRHHHAIYSEITIVVGAWLFLTLWFPQWTGLEKKPVHTGNAFWGNRKKLLKGVDHLRNWWVEWEGIAVNRDDRYLEEGTQKISMATCLQWLSHLHLLPDGKKVGKNL